MPSSTWGGRRRAPRHAARDWLLSRATYGNVVATIALFCSLGGASYAVVTLPARSVGPSQLQSRAVTPRTLAFPLGIAAIADTRSEDLEKGPCNSPVPPGGAVNVLCPRPLSVGLTSPHRELHLHLRARGTVHLEVAAQLQGRGAPGETVDIGLRLVLDGRVVAKATSTLVGNQWLAMPDASSLVLAAGDHTAGVLVDARYHYSGPGDATVGPILLSGMLLPRS